MLLKECPVCGGPVELPVSRQKDPEAKASQTDVYCPLNKLRQSAVHFPYQATADLEVTQGKLELRSQLV